MSLLKRVNPLVLIIVILILLCSFFYFKVEKLEIKNQDLKTVANIETINAKVWKDENNYSHYRASVSELNNISNIKNNEKLYNEIKKDLKGFDQVKSNLKNLTNYVNAISNLKVQKTIKLKDTTIYINDTSIVAKSFYFSDKYIKLSGTIINDSINPKIELKDTLTIVQYWHRKWFLGRKKTNFEIKNNNPYISVTNAKVISVRK